MNENTGHFRSVAFGGFHRQDVLDHLETLTREHREAMAQAEAETAALKEALSQAEEARDQGEARQRELEDLLQAAADCQKELEEELSALKNQLCQRETSLKEAETQTDQLRRRVDALVPGAASWQRIKDTAGDIEVSAHERAQITIQEAQVQAAEVRANGLRWVMEIQNCCDKMQKDLHSSLQNAQDELAAVLVSFTNTEQAVARHRDSLAALLSAAETE